MSILRSAPRKLWSFLNIINSIVPKNDKKIFIYSNLGFRDNVRAIYDYLIENGFNREYRIICSLNDYNEQSAQENVRFVSNLRGLFSFFSCRYVFYCFGKYPVKPRRGQAVFNLWHGMPLKRVGNMVSGFEKTDYNYFTYILCTSEFFRDIMKKSFSCEDNQVAICGQPRTDEMIKSAKLSGNGEKLLLWLPTFRNGSSDELDILTPEQFKSLDSMCDEYGWMVFVKLHPLSETDISEYSGFKNIVFMTQQKFEREKGGLYTLLGRADCLITDYSSVYFDYLLLDRPIGFAVKDIEKYGGERGFAFENPSDYMPGEVFSDGEKMLEFIKSVFDGKDSFKERRKELNGIFNKYNDGENCRRALEIMGIRKQ